MLLFLFLMFNDPFVDGENQWRQEREMSMKAEDSWLTVAGLYWLEEGPNRFGTDEKLEIVLPPHASVAHAGTFTYRDGKVNYHMNRAQRAQIDGKSAPKGTLEMGQILQHNHIKFFLIERGGKLALRIRDLRARPFLEFEKLEFYRPRKRYVVEATFEPYDQPDKLTVSTVIDTELEYIVPGKLKFEYRGKNYEILPTIYNESDTEFFIMFKDQTSGSTTYDAGRYMYVPRPQAGEKVTINFNRAYNPPCAYTDYATCPLPPAENWLQFPVEAGERIYKRK